jgi:hypothetical protein
MSCYHEVIELDYVPQIGKGSNVMVLTLRAQCRDCGPLRFLGIDEGISLSRPATNIDGSVLHLPVLGEFEEPEHERMAS